MIEKGYWISNKDKSDWEIYKQESNWIDNMIKFLSNKETKVLNEHGV